MKSALIASLLAAAVLFPAAASATAVEDRNAAIGLCRAEIAQQAGLTAEQVRLDNVRVSGRSVRVDLDVWQNGALQNIRCEVSRGQELTIAAITPALTQTASAATATQ
jgi:hypothetical protein